MPCQTPVAGSTSFSPIEVAKHYPDHQLWGPGTPTDRPNDDPSPKSHRCTGLSPPTWTLRWLQHGGDGWPMRPISGGWRSWCQGFDPYPNQFLALRTKFEGAGNSYLWALDPDRWNNAVRRNQSKRRKYTPAKNFSINQFLSGSGRSLWDDFKWRYSIYKSIWLYITIYGEP